MTRCRHRAECHAAWGPRWTDALFRRCGVSVCGVTYCARSDGESAAGPLRQARARHDYSECTGGTTTPTSPRTSPRAMSELPVARSLGSGLSFAFPRVSLEGSAAVLKKPRSPQYQQHARPLASLGLSAAPRAYERARALAKPHGNTGRVARAVAVELPAMMSTRRRRR